MSLVAGIDYDSEGIYLALVDLDDLTFQGLTRYDLAVAHSPKRPEPTIDRARRVRDLMPARGSWADAGVVAIGLEDTRSRSYVAASALKRVQGAILACLPRDVELFPLQANIRRGWKVLGSQVSSPTTLDGAALKANAPKDAIADVAVLLGAPAALRQDYYDAFLIARAAARLYDETHGAAAVATRGAA